MISGHIDDRLGPAEKEAFDFHLRRCAACRKELEEAQAVHDILTSAERFSAPYGFAARVMTNLKEKESVGFPRLFVFRPYVLRAMETAFALIVLFIGMISGNIWVTERPVPQGEAGIQQSFSLDVFEAAPPNSVAGAYIAMARKVPFSSVDGHEREK